MLGEYIGDEEGKCQYSSPLVEWAQSRFQQKESVTGKTSFKGTVSQELRWVPTYCYKSIKIGFQWLVSPIILFKFSKNGT